MKKAINTRFKKISLVCLAVLLIAGAAITYFKIFRNEDNSINTEKTITTKNSFVRNAQFLMLPSKRLVLSAPSETLHTDKGYAQTITFDHEDMKAMDNDVFYYLDLDGSRILAFKTFSDPDDYSHYKCIAIETSYPDDTKKFIMPLERIALEGNGNPPYINENGIIPNYYANGLVWVDKEENTIVSSKEIKHGSLLYNCILTTLDDTGNPEGGIDPKTLKLYGKYYTSYESIAKARPWKQPENFKKYFNNEIVFPHLEDFQRDAAEVVPKTDPKT